MIKVGSAFRHYFLVKRTLPPPPLARLLRENAIKRARKKVHNFPCKCRKNGYFCNFRSRNVTLLYTTIQKQEFLEPSYFRFLFSTLFSERLRAFKKTANFEKAFLKMLRSACAIVEKILINFRRLRVLKWTNALKNKEKALFHSKRSNPKFQR